MKYHAVFSSSRAKEHCFVHYWLLNWYIYKIFSSSSFSNCAICNWTIKNITGFYLMKNFGRMFVLTAFPLIMGPDTYNIYVVVIFLLLEHGFFDTLHNRCNFLLLKRIIWLNWFRFRTKRYSRSTTFAYTSM